MPIDLVTTGYGRPALRALRDVVAAAKGGDPLVPVTVVVPTNHVGVAARRMLAAGTAGPVVPGCSGLVGVTFLTPYRLAEQLGAPRLAAAGRRPASTPVIAAAVRQALLAAPGMFAPVARHPATEAALVAAYGHLADVSDRALAAVAAAGPRSSDVTRICRRAQARLSSGWYDEADLCDAAVEATVTGEAPLAPGLVVVHLVQELSRRQARLLRAVADRWPTTVVAASSGSPTADAGVARSLDRLGCKAPGDPVLPPPAPSPVPAAGDGAAGDRDTGDHDAGDRAAGDGAAGDSVAGGWGGGTRRAATWPVTRERTRLLTASDADDEVRAAVRAVVDAARGGTPLERVAVLYGAAEPYGRLLHEHLGAAGIPRNGLAVRPLAAGAVGQVVTDLLALPDHDFRRRDVMGLLSRTAVRLGHGAAAPVGEWERLSREAGVVAGRHDWGALLARLADGLDERAARLDERPAPPTEAAPHDIAPNDQAPGDGRTGTPGTASGREAAGETAGEVRVDRAEQARARATYARELRELVLHLIDELTEAAAAPAPWRARVRWLRRLTGTLLGDAAERWAWPADEHRIADKVDAALERLAALDAIEGPAPLDTFRRTLDLELDADLGRVGRFGEGALVAPLSFAPGLDLDLVVVVGLAEGTLPATVRDDSLLPDHERRRAGGEIELRRERVEREHRYLRAALAGAERHLLCAPRGDLRASNERAPSRWLLEVAEQLVGRRLGPGALLGLDAEWVTHVPSYAHAVTHALFPATEQDYRLRAGPVRAPDPVAVAGAEVVRSRRSPAFTRFDGNLAGLTIPSPVADTTSATRLEAWATCPHAYLVRYLLGVEPVADPERRLAITPLDRGSLVHEVFERFVSRVISRPAEAQPGPDEPWGPDDRRAMAEIAAAACDDYEARGLTGRPVFWRRDRAQVVALAGRFLREDERHRSTTRTRPVAAELTFGRPRARAEAVAFPLDDGRVLRFGGAVDRIDLADDGTLVVTDYKTGRSSGFARLGPDDPDQRGTRLQLVVYAQAARALLGEPEAPARADYWFVSDREGFVRRGYPVDEAVLARARAVLTTITRGIEQGVFPPHPEDNGLGWVTCPYCDPDGMGVTDLRRDWERKRDDPGVATYAGLAEPPAPADEEPAR